MECKKCHKQLEESWVACPYCGYAPAPRTARKRANSTGTAFKRGSTWYAQITASIEVLPDGKVKRKYITKGGFRTKTEALDYCSRLLGGEKRESNETLQHLYDRWLPSHEGRVGPSTIAGYKAAFQHFKPLHTRKVQSIKTDDWQACIDACPRGKRVKEDMRTVAGLLNKFAYNQDLIDKNYAANLFTGKDRKGTRPPFTAGEVDAIQAAIGLIPYADYTYFLIYTGFRPSELFALTKASYDPENHVLIGGGKTKAGTDRIVPITAKTAGILQVQLENPTPWLFPRANGEQMTERYFREECFNPLMEQLGISDRLPYSCRHTFANLLKNVSGSDTDKAALIGHADASMTKYYQSADVSALRDIMERVAMTNL